MKLIDMLHWFVLGADMACRTILLVEDDPADEQMAVMALKDTHPTDHLVAVRDAEEALDYLHLRGRYEGSDSICLPNVVLLDIRMPQRNGLDVLADIRKSERTRHIPVVVFTSSHDPADMQRAYEMGANSFIVKPEDGAQYQDFIRQIGAYWLSVNSRVIVEE